MPGYLSLVPFWDNFVGQNKATSFTGGTAHAVEADCNVETLICLLFYN